MAMYHFLCNTITSPLLRRLTKSLGIVVVTNVLMMALILKPKCQSSSLVLSRAILQC